MAKNFDMTKMKRGKSLAEAAQSIEDIGEDTVRSIDDLIESPRKEKVTGTVAAIRRDPLMKETDKKMLLDVLRGQFADLFNFQNCPEDYESLKLEAHFLSDLTQFSFLLLGQRLKKIRDNELYRQDGYDDFKAFVEQEIKIARSTAYNYIDLISVFGVQTFGHRNPPDPSKLIPLLPLFKANREDIPEQKLKSRFIEEAKTKSARDIQEEAKKLKIKYGLAKEPEDVDRLEKAFNGLMGVIPEQLTPADKKRIRSFINKLNALLGNK